MSCHCCQDKQIIVPPSPPPCSCRDCSPQVVVCTKRQQPPPCDCYSQPPIYFSNDREQVVQPLGSICVIQRGGCTTYACGYRTQVGTGIPQGRYVVDFNLFVSNIGGSGGGVSGDITPQVRLESGSCASVCFAVAVNGVTQTNVSGTARCAGNVCGSGSLVLCSSDVITICNYSLCCVTVLVANLTLTPSGC
jgi:hypothetical protein